MGDSKPYLICSVYKMDEDGDEVEDLENINIDDDGQTFENTNPDEV